MVAGDDDAPPEARPAGLDDLVFLCRALNEASARYVVIGGMAIIEAGFVRATEGIDLLWETKQTVREKDRLDRLFLESLRANRGDDETS